MRKQCRSPNCAERAASGEQLLTKAKRSRFVMEGAEDVAVATAVQWLLWHIVESGAELIPNADFDGHSKNVLRK